jgi:uroporphyrinogen decarboxylase
MTITLGYSPINNNSGKGVGFILYRPDSTVKEGASVVGASAETGRRIQKRTAIQGALDPLLMRAGGPALDARVETLLEQWGDGPYIFNLGHGLLPDTPIDHIARVVARVTGS